MCVVTDVEQVPGIARLGVDPLSPEFTRDAFGALLAGRRTQIKGLLRDQSEISGVGNAYSDEILHDARMSPFALASSLTDKEVDTFSEAVVTALRDAAAGKPTKDLKDAKRAGMRVHGRTG